MYAIRSYYGDYAYVNDTNELELSNEDFTIDLFVRITSYNVCYTKLLRYWPRNCIF